MRQPRLLVHMVRRSLLGTAEIADTTIYVFAFGIGAKYEGTSEGRPKLLWAVAMAEGEAAQLFEVQYKGTRVHHTVLQASRYVYFMSHWSVSFFNTDSLSCRI